MRSIRLVRVLFPVTFLIVALFIQVAQAPEHEDAIVSTVDAYVDTSHPLRIGRGMTFFAVNRSWLFYYEAGSNWYFTSSVDGSTWATPTFYRKIQMPKLAFRYDETRNLLHVVFGSLVGQGAWYQRATPYANGTLEWGGSNIISGVGYIDVIDIDVDSNGYVYAMYENASDVMANKNSYNSSNWASDTGFPYWVNTTGLWSLRTQVNVLANDNVLFLYADSASPPATPLYSRLYCANNGTWNAQTNATRYWCGTGGQSVAFSSTVRGNDVHMYYHSYDGMGSTSYRYKSMYNYSTLTWDYMNEENFGTTAGAGDLCYDSINDRVYFLGMESGDDSALDLWYWLPNGTRILQENIEESITLNVQYFAGTHTTDQYGRMGVAWCQTNYPPFVLRYAWISPDLSPPSPPDDEEDEPFPDLVSMYIHLYLMILAVLMMFFAVIYWAWGIRKKGIDENTIERGGYCMLIFLVGFALLIVELA